MRPLLTVRGTPNVIAQIPAAKAGNGGNPPLARVVDLKFAKE
jgi:hypothetical protein